MTTNTERKLVNPGAWDDFTGQHLWKVEAMYSKPIYVFAPCLQDALDETVDETTFLDYLKLDTSDWSEADWESNGDGIGMALGNAGEVFESDMIHATDLGPVTASDMLSAWIDERENRND